MKVKKTLIPDMVAKIEYMQSLPIVMSEADQRFLDVLKAKLLREEAEVTKRDFSRYERILGLDETHRVHTVKAADYGFARGLNFLEPHRRKDATEKRPPHDPFADIGKKVPASRPKRATGKSTPRGKKKRVST